MTWTPEKEAQARALVVTPGSYSMAVYHDLLVAALEEMDCLRATLDDALVANSRLIQTFGRPREMGALLEDRPTTNKRAKARRRR
jgi:hypothetical protein